MGIFNARTLIVTAAMLAGPGVAVAMELEMGSQVRLNAGYLSLNHNASGVTPPGRSGMTSYGDPTSILSYEPLSRADIKFSLSGRGDEGWFDLIAGFPMAGGGTFADRDYEAGQALYSETFSDIALGAGGNVGLRYGLPTETPLTWRGMAVRPYVAASLGLERYAAQGLRCGDACPSGPIADDITVIGQDLLTGSAGIGVWLENQISEAGTIDIRLEVNGGYLGVSDSHYLRVFSSNPRPTYELGPVPNIAYDFATLGARGEIAYRYETENQTTLSVSAFAGGQLGLGGVRFGNAATGQSEPYWAWSVAGEAGVTLGASVPF